MLVMSYPVDVEASTDRPLATAADTIAIGVFDGEGVAHDLPDHQLATLLDSGEAHATFERVALTHHQDRRVILIGLGARSAFDGERARIAAALVGRRAREVDTQILCWEVPHHVDSEMIEGLVHGTRLGAYPVR